MTRAFNFSAGPAMLPLDVLQQVHDELFDWHELGFSITEMSHRSSDFVTLAEQIEQTTRDLLNIPNHYKVLFLHGGATSQFAMVPLNLLNQQNITDYFVTGIWSKKAMGEAAKYAKVNVVTSSEEDNFITIPDPQSWQFDDKASYRYYVSNETINGVQFKTIPDSGSVPLVVDMSSDIFSKPIDISRFGLIFACAQKNFGIAGVTLVIIDENILSTPHPLTPSMFDYRKHIEQHSLLNTSPIFNWYVAGLMLDWIKDQGGLEHFAKLNQTKADKLYRYIDESEFYHCKIDKQYRSTMNVVFALQNSKLEKAFLEDAKEADLIGLKGHRIVGGMRASLYNAMPEQGVDSLIEFMHDFSRKTHV